MNKKIGRNDPCPCGSNLKYKKCHGKDQQQFNDQMHEIPFDQGLIIKDYTGKNAETINLGSPGVIVSDIVYFNGRTKDLNENPKKYLFLLNVDIPVLLPLNDNEKYTINFEGDQYVFFHNTKKRGEEFFSTLDSSKLPYFSTIQIQGISFNDEVSEQNKHRKSYNLIIFILEQIIEFSRLRYPINLEKEPILSYFILFYENEEFPNGKPFAKATYPYSGVIEIKDPQSKKEIDNESLKRFLSEQFNLQSYSLREIAPNVIDKTFGEKVFITAHDFSYYCSQHPQSISKLEEEEIRDLYLIVLKNIFTYAEGEPYNYKGKLDFKIIDQSNKYVFITGELKIWRSENSIIEVFDQVVRLHNSGQEHELYILVINKNKNLSNVRNKVNELILKEPEFLEILDEQRIPKGSFQAFDRYLLKIRERQVPLNVGFIDLYFE